MDDSLRFAKKYLEDLLSFFGINTEVSAVADDDIIELNIPSTQLNGFLIGQRGETIRSIQFLTGSALKNGNYAVSRVNVDVADYKKQRAERLAETAQEWIASVKETGQPFDVRPMNAADRRIIHQAAADAGIVSESVGDGRDRHIVLKPAE